MGKNRTQKTTVEPWRAAQPALQDVLGRAANLNASGGFRVDPYQGPRVADFSAMTNQGIDMLGQVQGQTPQVRSAFNDMVTSGGGRYSSGALTDMLSNESMYRDFDTIRARVGDQTKANLASMFAGGGINSGLAQDTASRAMSEALAGVEYGAYGDAQARRLQALGIDANSFENQQARRMQGLGMAPALQDMDIRAAGARLTGGGLRDDLAQRRIDADMAFQRESESADMDALMRYSGLVQGIGGMGSSGSSTAPNPNNIFSAAATGAGTYGGLAKAAATVPALGPLALPIGIAAGLGSLF